MKKAEEFLKRHRLRAADISIDEVVAIFTADMIAGLNGQEGALSMIPTFIEAENEFLKDTLVLAIDAGGTNFRAALVKFTAGDEIEITEQVSYPMPGLEKEIGADEFFGAIAGYVAPLASKTDRVGFCFSYPTEILPTRDGRLITFCKEVKAKGVQGELVGKRLLEALRTPSKKIVVLNDTVATLLAGKSVAMNKSFDSYVGFILGTGTNTCYIEQKRNIIKQKDHGSEGTMIINVESGNFNKGPRTKLDRKFDLNTTDPGKYTFEKMFSGGYLGGLSLSVLKTAASEGVFSEESARMTQLLSDLSTTEMNDFLIKGGKSGNILSVCYSNHEDTENSTLILNELINRASKLVAANLAAVILKTGRGLTEEKPVLITIDGTTYYNLHTLKSKFEKCLSDYLSGERKRYVEMTGVGKSGLIGAALAGLIE